MLGRALSPCRRKNRRHQERRQTGICRLIKSPSCKRPKQDCFTVAHTPIPEEKLKAWSLPQVWQKAVACLEVFGCTRGARVVTPSPRSGVSAPLFKVSTCKPRI